MYICSTRWLLGQWRIWLMLCYFLRFLVTSSHKMPIATTAIRHFFSCFYFLQECITIRASYSTRLVHWVDFVVVVSPTSVTSLSEARTVRWGYGTGRHDRKKHRDEHSSAETCVTKETRKISLMQNQLKLSNSGS